MLEAQRTLLEDMTQVNLNSLNGLTCKQLELSGSTRPLRTLRLVNADGVTDHQRNAETKAFYFAVCILYRKVTRRNQSDTSQPAD
jgi:hypothetical protein